MKVVVALSLIGSVEKQVEGLRDVMRQIEDITDVSWTELEPEDDEDKEIYKQYSDLKDKLEQQEAEAEAKAEAYADKMSERGGCDEGKASL